MVHASRCAFLTTVIAQRAPDALQVALKAATVLSKVVPQTAEIRPVRCPEGRAKIACTSGDVAEMIFERLPVSLIWRAGLRVAEEARRHRGLHS